MIMMAHPESITNYRLEVILAFTFTALLFRMFAIKPSLTVVTSMSLLFVSTV